MSNLETLTSVSIEKWRNGETVTEQDRIAEETPVALEYNGISHAVMLATPSDLEDFALGFSLTEGILADPSELYSCEISGDTSGVHIEMEIASERFFALKQKRRSLTGRTGCGLCGTETLAQAVCTPARVDSNAAFDVATLHAAFSQMEQQQHLQHQTGATHAAAWLAADGQVTLVREDVGRHNALDKLIGALRKRHIATDSGAAIVTSRASYEMVQKAASTGIGILAAVSAPTALAVRIAQATGVTLIGYVRQQSHSVYAHPQRLTKHG